MPERYRVELSAQARIDLFALYDFIAEDSPRVAALWGDHMESEIASLEMLPFRCPVIPEARRKPRAPGIRADYRHLIVGLYRVIYRVEGRRVWVARILHGARTLTPGSL